MLRFMRNKLIGIERIAPDEILVHGLLDDDIYSLEIELRVRLSDLRIISIEGRWKRWTTPECPRAIEPLKEAIGLCVAEKGLYEKIRKEIGKASCRHFANLLIECCDTIRSGRDLIEKDRLTPSKAQEKVDIRDVFPVCMPEGGTLIDLHIHTYPASSCASSSIDEQIEEAKKAGLDAICITDHNYIWDRQSIMKLIDKHGFLIFRGTEITTDQGDILVFGLNKLPAKKGLISVRELRDVVKEENAFMIAAHPFRGFLISDLQSIGLTPEKASKRELFRLVDAVEVLNGRVNASENIFTNKVSDICNLPGTGGSDAHETAEIGIYATYFQDRIETEEELIEALKSKVAYSACILKGRFK